MFPKTFCVLPFYQVTISHRGKVSLCCRAEFDIMSEDRAPCLDHATLEQVWNSDYLRLVRGRMIGGEEIEECANCYATELEGGTSLRQTMNTSDPFLFDVLVEDRILEKARAIVHDQDGMAPPPSALHLWLGNLCNLKCRMCCPLFSNQIASDPVHRQWYAGLAGYLSPVRPDGADNAGPGGSGCQPKRLLRNIMGKAASWASRLLPRVSVLPDRFPCHNPEKSWLPGEERVFFEESLQFPEYLRLIQFSGGEPLIHPLFPEILRRLVDDGHAKRIALYITSNGIRYSPRVSGLLEEFRQVEIALSIDGLGALQEYIRYPSKWDTVSSNILLFQQHNLSVSVRPTPQAYNIFGLLDLARWCERNHVRFVFDNVLRSPPFLSLDMLPQTVIDEALKEWIDYLDKECAEENRWHIETVIAALRRPRTQGSELAAMREDFIRFTNDLDRSRNQSLADACPRLHEGLVAAGFGFEGG